MWCMIFKTSLRTHTHTQQSLTKLIKPSLVNFDMIGPDHKIYRSRSSSYGSMRTRVRQSRSCVSLELRLGRRGILEPLTRRSKLNVENRKEVTEPALQQVRLGLYVQLSSYCTSRFSSDPNCIFRRHPTLPFFQLQRILSAAVNLPSSPAQVTVVFASMFHRKDFPRVLPSRRQPRTKQCVKTRTRLFPFSQVSPTSLRSFQQQSARGAVLIQIKDQSCPVSWLRGLVSSV